MCMDNHQCIGDNSIDDTGMARLNAETASDGWIMRPSQNKNCRNKRYRNDKGRKYAEARKYTEFKNRDNARKTEGYKTRKGCQRRQKDRRNNPRHSLDNLRRMGFRRNLFTLRYLIKIVIYNMDTIRTAYCN